MISAADFTCIVDTEYDPLKEHSHKVLASVQLPIPKKQGRDRLPVTRLIRKMRYTGNHSLEISSGAGADRHTSVADAPFIALLRSTRAAGDIDSTYSMSFSSDFPAGDTCR